MSQNEKNITKSTTMTTTTKATTGITDGQNQTAPLNHRTESSSTQSVNEKQKHNATSFSNDNDSSKASEQIEVYDDFNYPGFWKSVILMFGLYLTAFLVAMDRTILATAVPKITAEFNSLGDVGWYGSSYLLTSCSFQLLFGKLFGFYNPKWVFLVTILLFSVGSIVCATAKSSHILIIGRAISGVGSAGVNSGVLIILTQAIHPKWRTICTGFMGVCFGIATVVGPIIGGSLATYASWKWIFWINIPSGFFTTVIVLLFLRVPKVEHNRKKIYDHYDQFDLIGTLLFFPSIISLLLGTQWGGSKYQWNSSTIIGLFITSGVLFIIFIIIEIWRGDDAMIPPRVIVQRSIISGIFFSFCLGASLMTMVYYLPIWFQAIQGNSAIKSGVHNLPLLVALVLSSISVRGFISGLGYYAPFMIISALFMSIGSGLLTTLNTNTSFWNLFGYELLYGIGIGFGLQQSVITGLTVVDKKDIGLSTSLMLFSQTLGGAIFVSVGQNVFSKHYVDGIQPFLGNRTSSILKTSATALRSKFENEPLILNEVIHSYNWALRMVFIVILCLSCLCALSSLGIEWKNTKEEKRVQDVDGLIA